MKLKTLKDLNLPIIFHNIYEEEADNVGWETNRKCRVKFDDLPETNQETMIRTCERVRQHIKQEAIKWVKSYFVDANSNRLPGKATARGAIYALMNFFNITEDELK